MSRGTALVIDDEKNIRLTLSKCLKYIDLDATTAINGEEGLKKLEERSFDIIFLDLKMQGMGGVETLKRIKVIDPKIPVIIVTAHGTVDSAVEAMKLGAVDFMQKPFTPREIQDIVEEVLSMKDLEKESPDDSDSHIQYAKQLIMKKDYDGAVEELKTAIMLSPKKAEPYNMLGAIKEINGELEDAMKCYKEALALDPAYERAKVNLSRVDGKIKNST